MKVLPFGDRGLLVEVADPDLVLRLAAALGAEPGVEEAVPAARTVLVQAKRELHDRLRARVAELLDSMPAVTGDGGVGPVELPVHYAGADLTDTAAELGMDTDELVRRHTAPGYVVAFCGFAPGFAYLRGLDPALHVARLSEPRTKVPAGAVGVAGEFTGVYPRASPGGWRLLGRTEAELWDPDRAPPALLAPGTRVRFVAT